MLHSKALAQPKSWQAKRLRSPKTSCALAISNNTLSSSKDQPATTQNLLAGEGKQVGEALDNGLPEMMTPMEFIVKTVCFGGMRDSLVTEKGQKEPVTTQNPSSGARDLVGGPMVNSLLEVTPPMEIESGNVHFEHKKGSRPTPMELAHFCWKSYSCGVCCTCTRDSNGH